MSKNTENDVFDFSLSRDDMKRIDALDSGVRIRFDPARRFDLKAKAKFLLTRLKLQLREAVRVAAR